MPGLQNLMKHLDRDVMHWRTWLQEKKVASHKQQIQQADQRLDARVNARFRKVVDESGAAAGEEQKGDEAAPITKALVKEQYCGLFGRAFEAKIDFEWSAPDKAVQRHPVLLCGLSYVFEPQWGYLTSLELKFTNGVTSEPLVTFRQMQR